MGKRIINWASSNLWALITLLYSLKWILGQPMHVYLSIYGILNWACKLATGAPSKSSQLMTPSEILIYLSLYSSLSIRACVSSKARMGAMIGSGVALVWLCKTYGARCGTNWLSGGGGVVSHGRNELVNGPGSPCLSNLISSLANLMLWSTYL